MNLVKSHSNEAIKQARQVDKPRFRAQALALVARFAGSQVISIFAEAAEAAAETGSRYQQWSPSVGNCCVVSNAIKCQALGWHLSIPD